MTQANDSSSPGNDPAGRKDAPPAGSVEQQQQPPHWTAEETAEQRKERIREHYAKRPKPRKRGR